MQKYISLVAVLSLSTFVSSPMAGQTQDTKVDAAVSAVLFVHPGHAASKLLLVPTAAVEGGLANMVAARIGAKASGRHCGKKTICDPPPAEDVLAIGVEIVSIDEESALVRVVTRGLNKPANQARRKQWISVSELSMVRSAKKWVVKSQSVLRT